MNLRVVVAIILAILILAIVFRRAYQLEHSAAPFVDAGRYSELVVVIPKGEWRFSPDVLRVVKGERFSIRVKNDDDISHGFALDPYGVMLEIPPHDERVTPNLLAEKSGTTTFYCSLMCGEGLVLSGAEKGKTRGHFDMEGAFVVAESGE